MATRSRRVGSLRLLAGIALCLTVSALAAFLFVRSQASGFRHEGFEGILAPRYWKLDASSVGTSPGTIGVVARSAHSGRHALRIGYDFSRGGQHVVVTGPPPKLPDLRGMRFWVRNPGGNPLAIRVRDAVGHVFQRDFRTRTDRWEQAEMLFGLWDERWDGPPDRVFRYPPRRIALVVGPGQAPTGEIVVDDLEAVGVADVGRRAAWYTALGESDAGSSGLFRGDIELKGRPLRLRVRLRGAAASDRCFIRIGSGWTEFTKSVPIRASGVRQTALVSLEDLGDWRYEGFLADGLAALPLRLKEARVEAGGSRGARASGASDQSDGSDRAAPILLSVEALTLPAPSNEIDLEASGRVSAGMDTWTCAMTNLTGGTVSGALSLTVRDWAGNRIASASRSVSLTAGASRTERFSPQSGTQPCRIAEFVLRTARREYGPAEAAIVSPAQPVPQCARTPRWGVGAGLAFIQPGPKHDAQRERIAGIAKRAGIRFGIELMFWEWAEPERGIYRWERFDAAVNTLLKHGIAPYGIIGYWSRWTKPYTREGIRDYAGYCRALVKHFRGRVRHWELWNEPNGGFWTGPKDFYPVLVAEATRAIKETDPGAMVIAGSAAPMDPKFLRAVAATGAPFDAVSVHPYGLELDQRLLAARLQHATQASAHPDGHPRSLWVTETGSAVLPGTARTLSEQAASLARTYITAIGPGRADHVAWVRMTTGPSRSDSDEQLGLLSHPDLSSRPAYRALQTIGRVIGDARFVSSDPAPAGIGVQRFRHPNHDVLAICSMSDPAVVAVAWRQSAAPGAMDLMGRRIPIVGIKPEMLVLPRGEPILVSAAPGDAWIASAPVRLHASEACLSGETVEVRLELARALANVPITVEAPDGWRARLDRPSGRLRVCRIGVPAAVGPGVRLIRFLIGGHDGPIAVPLRLTVYSPVIPL